MVFYCMLEYTIFNSSTAVSLKLVKHPSNERKFEYKKISKLIELSIGYI